MSSVRRLLGVVAIGFAILASANSLASSLPPTCTSQAPGALTVGKFDTVQRVYAYGVKNATSVVFPTWWVPSNKGDIQQVQGINLGNGTWYADITLSQFDGSSNQQYGSFETDVYLVNSGYNNGQQIACGQSFWTRASDPTETSIYQYTFTPTEPGLTYPAQATIDQAEQQLQTLHPEAKAGLSFSFFSKVSGKWQFKANLDYRPYGGLSPTITIASASPAEKTESRTAALDSTASLRSGARLALPSLSPPLRQADVVTPPAAVARATLPASSTASYKEIIIPGGQMPGNACTTHEGDPCVLANGSQKHVDEDFTYGAITFRRYYNALRIVKPYAAIDNNWSATFSSRIFTSDLTNSHQLDDNSRAPGPMSSFIVAKDDEGLIEFYKPVPTQSTTCQSSGPPNCRTVFRSTIEPGKVLVADFRTVTGYFAWTIHHADGHQDLFDTHGRLIRVVYPEDPSRDYAVIYQSTTTDWTQQSNWLIARVIDGKQRNIYFHYASTSDPHNPYVVLSSITNDNGNVLASYSYDAQQNLQSVTYLDGKSKSYAYGQSSHFDDSSMSMPHNLTQITDENGNDYADFGYDQHGRSVWSNEGAGANYVDINYADDASVRATRASGEVVTYSFPSSEDDQSFRKPASVTHSGDPTHNVPGYSESWTYGYQDSSCVTQDERLCRHTDSHGVTTEYQYDDLFERVRIEGVGTPQQRRVETDYTKPSAGSSQYGPIYRVAQRRIYGLDAGGNEVLQSQVSYSYDMTYDGNYGWDRSMILAKCEADPQVSGAATYNCKASGTAPTGVRRWVYTYCQYTATYGTNNLGCPIGDFWLNSVTDPLGSITTYTYQQANDATSCASPVLPVTGNCFNDGDLAYVTNAINKKSTNIKKYDAAGRIKGQINLAGVETDYNYDPRGRVLASALVNTTYQPPLDYTNFSYDNAGNLLSVKDPDNVTISYGYDVAHRLTDVKDPSGNYIHYTLDALGNRVEEDSFDPTSTLKRTMSRSFDALNRLSASVDGQLNSTTFTYDASNRVSDVTDALNIVNHSEYDGLGRLSASTQNFVSGGAVDGASNVKTQYAYDVDDHITRITDPDLLVTSYSYSAFHELGTLSSPDTGQKTSTYDNNGNLKTVKDARGITATYHYDNINRLTSISYPTTSLNVAFGYDSINSCTSNTAPTGRLTSFTDISGNTKYCYDRKGNVLVKTQTTNGKLFTTAYTYTPGWRVKTITYPSGGIVTYTYDANGAASNITYMQSFNGTPSTVISSVSRLPFGPINGESFGDGHSLPRLYDQNYSMTNAISTLQSGLQLGLSYSATNQVASSMQLQMSGSIQYGYDGLQRLSGVSFYGGGDTIGFGNGEVEAFSYNGTGDRISENTPILQRYTYVPGTHHLNDSGIGDFRSYDANGNTLSRSDGKTFTYDNRNRLSQVTVPGVGTYFYMINGKGERVLKAGPSGAYFVYDESGHLIGEYDGNGSLISEYVYLDGAPVAIVKPGGKLYFVETDQIGAPRAVIDPAREVAVWTWDTARSPFGEGGPSVDPDGDSQQFSLNLRFPGQYYDVETGLNYNYFRDYEPGTGRYVESDPSGLPAGISTYGYGKSNPLTFLDPTGLSVTWKGSVWGGGITAGFGGQLLHFHLVSECKCNKKYEISGFASFLTYGGGIGWKENAQIGDLSGSGGGTEMEDPYSDCPDPGAANGAAWTSGINVVAIGGGSLLSRFRLGRLQTYEFASGPSFGFDISATATLWGQSAVWYEKKIDCCGH